MYTDSMFQKKHKDRTKNITSSVKWNKKNEVYLKELGFIDTKGRNPRNISGLINMAVTHLLEQGQLKIDNQRVSPAELSLAFRKACVAERNIQIKRLEQERQQILDWQGVQ